MGLNPLTSKDELTLQARNGYITSLVFFIGAGAAIPIYGYIAVQGGELQLYVGVIAAVLVAITSGISVVLCRQNRALLGMMLLSGSIIVAGAISAAVYAGLGLLIGLIVFAFLLQISVQTIPPHLSSRVLLIAIVAWIGMAALDLLALPWEKYDAPLILQITLILTGAVTVVESLLIGRQFLSYTLGIKLTLSFLAVSLISAALIAGLSYYFISQGLVESADKVLLAGASQTAAGFDNFITTNKDALRAEAQLPTLVTYLSLPPEQRADSSAELEAIAVLRALSRKDPINISSYSLLDKSGWNVLDTFTAGIGLDKSNTDYFLEPLRDRLPYVSPVQFSEDFPGTAGLYFSNAIIDNGGQTLGVLVVRYHAGVLQQIARQYSGLVGEGSVAILLDENYIRLADGGDPGLVFTVVGPSTVEIINTLQDEGRLPVQSVEGLSVYLPGLKQALDGQEGTANFTAALHPDETEDFAQGAVAPTDNLNWLVVLAQPRSVFLEPVARQTQPTLLSALGITAFVVVIALLVAQLLSGPIARLTAVAEQVAAGNLRAQAQIESGDEIGKLATTFNNMTAQLADLVGSLEQRVADRTKALSTSAEVSRSLSTILNQRQLVSEVVEQVRAAFDYSHAQIYLVDETGRELVMAGGTGHAGATMLASQHKILWGKGLVGRAADTNASILVPDVSQDPGWLPNPLLMDTKAEIAVPIATGEKVLGVLDVQHNVTNGLTDEDAKLLESIANQVAVALQNARLLEQAQRRAEREALVNAINQKIQRAATVESVLQIASEELGKALGTQSSTVQIGLGSSKPDHSSN